MDTLEVATSGLPIPNIAASDYNAKRESADNLSEISNNDINMMSSDEEGSIKITKKRRKCFTNSSTDDECVNSRNNLFSIGLNDPSNEDSDIPVIKQSERKSRIKNNNNTDSSLSNDEEVVPRKKVVLSKRDRKKKLHKKFEKLNSKENKKSNISNCLEDNISDEGISCLKINQKIKEDTKSINLSVCDPDESDEKDTTEIKKIIGSKSISTKSKSLNMSAKEAMANMQKIKSESNRMLREKDVTLPYHRPKALSLKDIMSRRRPAVTSDGKTLPIKMNEEQLKHYAMLLEERQKEMIELCKSDTDDENSGVQEEELEKESSNTINKVEDQMNIEEDVDKVDENNIEELAEKNDMSFDQITNVSMTSNNKTIVNVETATSSEVTDENINLFENTNTIQNARNDSRKTINNINISESSHNNSETMNSLGTNYADKIDKTFEIKETSKIVYANNTEESQAIQLQYDTERICNVTEDTEKIGVLFLANKNETAKTNEIHAFSDTELDYDDLDAFIENAEIIKDDGKEYKNDINAKPTLTGAPGMVINLDDDDEPIAKPSGIDLLKQRFTYFAKLQNQEDMDKDREKKFKPGTQHIKLKQQLEEEIAEQRSLEWTKRLEEEQLLKLEQKAILGDDSMEDIDKIEAKLEEEDEGEEEDKSESDDDLIENDVDMTDKPQNLNPMIDNEAEETDDNEVENDDDKDYDMVEGKANDDADDVNDEDDDVNDEDDDVNDEDDDVNDEDDGDSESSDSSDSEDELEKTKPKKGRILKAFEDSDEEDGNVIETVDKTVNEVDVEKNSAVETLIEEDKISQDDELQLAQANKSISEDLFSSQDSLCTVVTLNKHSEGITSGELGTFSILNTNTSKLGENEPDKDSLDDIPVINETQPDDAKFDEIAGMCSGSFSQNIIIPTQKSQLTPSLEIGDDIVALCTGKFYDNQFVSQTNIIDKGLQETASLNTESLQSPLLPNTENNTQCSDTNTKDAGDTINTDSNTKDAGNTINTDSNTKDAGNTINTDSNTKDAGNTINTDSNTKKTEENALLKSILDELDEPEFDKPKQYKYFTAPSENIKKKLVIDSDDDTNAEVGDKIVKKKKKRKLEKRALQISDDEEEEIQTDNEEYSSDVVDDDDENENVEKLYEYDSEENEVEVQVKPKKKRRAGEFFENEAELTSEDEWAGSGDEDEAGLDRMEREEGDDEVFHQGRLQRELGQIHMREVLDQDKREVRIIQELLLEDADLGDGHRQRKFRWKNIDGEEESGAVVDEFGDTQEEEFESEELWRKQRHEREMFLRKIQQENGEEDLNTSINRTTIIKANLSSRTMSNLVAESKQGPIEKEITSVPEKKPTKDIPSPKKPFAIFKQNYHGSLLTRGRGALARLAALATPLVVDDDTPKVLASARGNFVFTARNNDEPKVKKRKAETSVNTPQLIKKMKTEEYKKTLFDRLRD